MVVYTIKFFVFASAILLVNLIQHLGGAIVRRFRSHSQTRREKSVSKMISNIMLGKFFFLDFKNTE